MASGSAPGSAAGNLCLLALWRMRAVYSFPSDRCPLPTVDHRPVPIGPGRSFLIISSLPFKVTYVVGTSVDAPIRNRTMVARSVFAARPLNRVGLRLVAETIPQLNRYFVTDDDTITQNRIASVGCCTFKYP